MDTLAHNSADKKDELAYPTKFLNNITPSGCPNHVIVLGGITGGDNWVNNLADNPVDNPVVGWITRWITWQTTGQITGWITRRIKKMILIKRKCVFLKEEKKVNDKKM